jgi:molybdopterin-guanine dinucleotide biosynthesis protein A
MTPATPWSPPPLVAGLLVGGGSRRMGRPKALVELAGVPLAERAAAAARSIAADLVLLGDGPVPRSLAACPRIPDPEGVAGPLAAALAAFAARPGAAWLLLGCDQALASAAACAWLAGERASDRRAVLPRRGSERIEPLLAIYEPAALPLLAALRDRGELSLQPLAREAGVATPRVPDALMEAWTSVDSPAALAALESRLAGRTA